jgi:hypothetical protein
MRMSCSKSVEKPQLCASSRLLAGSLGILVSLAAGASAQATAKTGDAKEPTASISGRVTAEGKPLSGVFVSLSGGPTGGGVDGSGSAGRSTTDAEACPVEYA